MFKKSSVKTADAITNLMFLTVEDLTSNEKVFICIFPLVCFLF